MRRFGAVLLLFCWFLMPHVGTAQASVPEAAVPSPETMHRWLESGDPRLVAWAAFHAGEHVPESSDAMPSLRTHLLHLAQVYEPAYGWSSAAANPQTTQFQADRSLAMLAVLNTLMKWHAGLPAGDALRLYPEFKSVALVLLWNGCQADSSGCDAELMRFLQPPANLGDQVAAADMLAAKPPTGYAAALLRRIAFRVDLAVTLDGTNGRLGEGNSAGDCWNAGWRQNWPMIQQFYLHWKPEKKDDVPFLPGPVPIFLEPGMCQPHVPEWMYPESPVQDVESGLKLRLLGAALGLREPEMPVKSRTAAQIRWSDAEHFRTDVDAAYLRVRTGIGDLLEALIRKGLLRRDEAAGLLRADRPDLLQIRFQIFDARPEGGRDNPLPVMRFHDPHVRWAGWASPTSIVSSY